MRSRPVSACLCQGEFHIEGAPLIDLRFKPDRAVMLFYDLLTDSQAKPQPWPRRMLRRWCSIKGLEDVLTLLLGDALPGIVYTEHSFLPMAT